LVFLIKFSNTPNGYILNIRHLPTIIPNRLLKTRINRNNFNLFILAKIIKVRNKNNIYNHKTMSLKTKRFLFNIPKRQYKPPNKKYIKITVKNLLGNLRMNFNFINIKGKLNRRKISVTNKGIKGMVT